MRGLELWEVKIGMIVIHRIEAKVGVVTGLERRTGIETHVKVLWDDNFVGLPTTVEVDNLQSISSGRYAWVIRERKRKKEEDDDQH